MKAMAKDPADRYQTAEALRADLVRFGQGQGVLAPLVTPTMVAATGVLPRTPTTATRTTYVTEEPPRGGSRTGWLIGLLAGLLVVLAALIFFRSRVGLVEVERGQTGGARRPHRQDSGRQGGAGHGRVHQRGGDAGPQRNRKSEPGDRYAARPGHQSGGQQHRDAAGEQRSLPVGIPNVVGQPQATSVGLIAEGFKPTWSGRLADGGQRPVVSTDPSVGQRTPGHPGHRHRVHRQAPGGGSRRGRRLSHHRRSDP